MFKLPQLPYSKTALEPFLSSEAINFHYGKHHDAYISEVNRLIQKTRYERFTLEEIILRSDGNLLNNASQAWNHTFYWNCMRSPENTDGASIGDDLMSEIKKEFGSMAKFKALFAKSSMQLFGSGWVWLVSDRHKRMRIAALSNADSPLRYGFNPLLACDIWEHAYYIDYRNNRRRYIDGFLNSVNWSFVSKNHATGQIPDITKLMLSVSENRHPPSSREAS